MDVFGRVLEDVRDNLGIFFMRFIVPCVGGDVPIKTYSDNSFKARMHCN